MKRIIVLEILENETNTRLLRISKELKETEGYFSIGLNKLTDERLSNDLLMKVIIKEYDDNGAFINRKMLDYSKLADDFVNCVHKNSCRFAREKRNHLYRVGVLFSIKQLIK